MSDALMVEAPSPWLTAAEAGARAKVGRKAIYAAVEAGKLKATKVGTKLLFHVDWVDAWLASQVKAVNPDAPGPAHVFPVRR